MAAVIAALLALPPGVVKARAGLLYERESRYQFIQVVQQGPERQLYLNEGYAIHSVWRADTVLTGGEWDMFLTAPPLLGRPVRRVAILGNAGGTTARAFGVYYPQARIDGVEIDPAVTAVGRRYFGLGDNPRLTVFTADARPFLASTGARYDLILIDAYRQPYVPFYLATREFFRLVRSAWRPAASSRSTSPRSPATTGWPRPSPARWPPSSRRSSPGRRSLQPVRRRPHGAAAAGDAARAPGDRAARAAARHGLFARDLRAAAPAPTPWTDDRAPVEWVTDRMIAAYALRGAATPETLLPTAPR